MNVEVLRVRTAQEMDHAVFEYMEDSHIIIKAAAVSDYRPVDPADRKIKKESDEMVLSLEKTRDILEALGRRKNNRVLVGFAAETEDLEKNAEKKLKEKNLDIIAGNIVGRPDSGFESDTNSVTLFYKDGKKEALPVMEKEALAHILLDRIIDRMTGET